MDARMLAIAAFGFVCLTRGVEGQGLSQYRDFELGSDLASVATLAGVASSDAKTIHQRPAALQDLEWRPPHWIAGATAASTDPVEWILFSFYNDQLFRLVPNDWGGGVVRARELSCGGSSDGEIDRVEALHHCGEFREKLVFRGDLQVINDRVVGRPVMIPQNANALLA